VSVLLSLEATAEAFDSGAVALDATVDVVRCYGPDALSYLQGQCSQDLSGLRPGDGADALVLSAQGKLVALVRVWMVSEEDLAVAVAPGYGEVLFERLRRFKIRVKADLRLETWPAVSVRGPGSEAVLEAARAELGRAGSEANAQPGVAGRPALEAWPGVDLLGSATQVATALPRGDPEVFEAARIEAGRPAMGSELDESTIPHEAGIVGWTVSFTKGCYTGQELVARLDARGARVPRRLRGFVVEQPKDARPAPRSALMLADRTIGQVTSVAFSPFRGATIGLCYGRRELEVPTRCSVEDDAGPVSVTVQELPLWGPPGR
jgi:folate-binding protein YgfZ